MSLVNETTTATFGSLVSNYSSQDHVLSLSTTSAGSSVAETVTNTTATSAGDVTPVIVKQLTTTVSSLIGLTTDAISTAISTDVAGAISTTPVADDAPMDWMTIAILLGVVVASIIVAVIVVALILYVMRKRALKRRRTIKRVENPIYRQSGDTGHYSLHLGDNPTISLSNNNRVKNPELWASKDIKPQQHSSASHSRSDDRKPMLNAPAPFATGDDLETHDIFHRDNDQSNENLNVDLAEYAAVKKDSQQNGRQALGDEDAKPSDRLLPASADDDTAKVSTFAR